MIEQLEQRKLLAAINMVGTTANDVLTFAIVGGLLRISNTGPNTVTYNNGGTLLPNRSKSFADVDLITVDVGSGNDVINIDTSVNAKTTLLGGKGNDFLRGGANNDVISGGDGNDTILGFKGRDTLEGAAGNDLIRGGSGNDVISGDNNTSAGSDTLYGDDGNDSITGGGGGDALYGDDNDADSSEDGSDTLRGGEGVDYLNGNGGADSIFGDAGDDYITNIDGSVDTIDGGEGNDRAEPSNFDNDVLTNVETQSSVISAQNLAGFYAVFDGTPGNDVITLAQDGGVYNFTFNGLAVQVTRGELEALAEAQSGNEQLFGLVIRAGGGNDRVEILTPITLALEVYGDAGNDTLIGGPGGEKLAGGLGNDSLIGGAGNDMLVGGSDDDDLSGGDGRDTLQGDGDDDRNGNQFGLRGADRLSGDAQIDVVTYEDFANGSDGVTVTLDNIANDGPAGEGDNVIQDVNIIVGSFGNDLLIGNDTNQTLNGGGGDDTLMGMGGDDSLEGDLLNDGFGGNDVLDGGDGNDTLNGGEDETDADVFIGGAGIDTADYSRRGNAVRLSLDGVANDGAPFGNGEDDNIGTDVENLIGGSGNDTLTGSARANVLMGSVGQDLINGAGGNDTIDGGAGNDTQLGDGGNDLLLASPGADVLNGGSGIDTADYSARTTALVITIDDIANDGEAGENDNVTFDTDNIFGGSAGDHITGSGLRNTILGNAGGDTLFGVGGDDSLVGGGNSDQLFGGSGNDTLRGLSGADTMDGASGNDRFFNRDNDGLRDVINGGSGIDTADNPATDDDIITNVENIVG